MRRGFHVLTALGVVGLFAGPLLADNIFVSTYGFSRSIIGYTPSGASFPVVENGLYNPTAVIKDSAGNFYIANADGGQGSVNGARNTIQKVTPSGTMTTFASGLSNPTGMVVGFNGDILVANSGANQILRIAPDGSRSIFASAGLSNPHRLAWGPNGDLFVANTSENAIRRFSATGQDLGIFATAGLSNPYGMAFDRNGDLFVSNELSSIVRFKPDGSMSVFASASNISGQPYDIAFDSAGSLYVATYLGNSIQKFLPNGSSSIFVSNAGNPAAIYADPGFRYSAAIRQSLSITSLGAPDSYHPAFAAVDGSATGFSVNGFIPADATDLARVVIAYSGGALGLADFSGVSTLTTFSSFSSLTASEPWVNLDVGAGSLGALSGAHFALLTVPAVNGVATFDLVNGHAPAGVSFLRIGAIPEPGATMTFAAASVFGLNRRVRRGTR